MTETLYSNRRGKRIPTIHHETTLNQKPQEMSSKCCYYTCGSSPKSLFGCEACTTQVLRRNGLQDDICWSYYGPSPDCCCRTCKRQMDLLLRRRNCINFREPCKPLPKCRLPLPPKRLSCNICQQVSESSCGCPPCAICGTCIPCIFRQKTTVDQNCENTERKIFKECKSAGSVNLSFTVDCTTVSTSSDDLRQGGAGEVTTDDCQCEDNNWEGSRRGTSKLNSPTVYSKSLVESSKFVPCGEPDYCCSPVPAFDPKCECGCRQMNKWAFEKCICKSDENIKYPFTPKACEIYSCVHRRLVPNSHCMHTTQHYINNFTYNVCKKCVPVYNGPKYGYNIRRFGCTCGKIIGYRHHACMYNRPMYTRPYGMYMKYVNPYLTYIHNHYLSSPDNIPYYEQTYSNPIENNYDPPCLKSIKKPLKRKTTKKKKKHVVPNIVKTKSAIDEVVPVSVIQTNIPLLEIIKSVVAIKSSNSLKKTVLTFKDCYVQTQSIICFGKANCDDQSSSSETETNVEEVPQITPVVEVVLTFKSDKFKKRSSLSGVDKCECDDFSTTEKVDSEYVASDENVDSNESSMPYDSSCSCCEISSVLKEGSSEESKRSSLDSRYSRDKILVTKQRSGLWNDVVNSGTIFDMYKPRGVLKPPGAEKKNKNIKQEVHFVACNNLKNENVCNCACKSTDDSSFQDTNKSSSSKRRTSKPAIVLSQIELKYCCCNNEKKVDAQTQNMKNDQRKEVKLKRECSFKEDEIDFCECSSENEEESPDEYSKLKYSRQKQNNGQLNRDYVEDDSSFRRNRYSKHDSASDRTRDYETDYDYDSDDEYDENDDNKYKSNYRQSQRKQDTPIADIPYCFRKKHHREKLKKKKKDTVKNDRSNSQQSSPNKGETARQQFEDLNSIESFCKCGEEYTGEMDNYGDNTDNYERGTYSNKRCCSLVLSCDSSMPSDDDRDNISSKNRSY